MDSEDERKFREGLRPGDMIEVLGGGLVSKKVPMTERGWFRITGLERVGKRLFATVKSDGGESTILLHGRKFLGELPGSEWTQVLLGRVVKAEDDSGKIDPPEEKSSVDSAPNAKVRGGGDPPGKGKRPRARKDHPDP